MNTAIAIAAENALRTIRTECNVSPEVPGSGDRTALARRSGQLFVVVALLAASNASVLVSSLELAGVDRMVGPEELARHILRPLVARGFCRVSNGVVLATSALVMHADPIGAMMSGEALSKSAPVRTVPASDLRPGDHAVGVGDVVSRPVPDSYGMRVSVRRGEHIVEMHLHGVATVARAA